MKSYKHAYQRFLSADPYRLHFAAHSHHYWPDCTRDAHIRYWDDSALSADSKWESIFEKILPEARAHLAQLLRLKDPTTLVFAPNTHEFVARLFSSFEQKRPVRVVTTDSEFHSFSRQSKRLEEAGDIEIIRVAVEPRSTFTERLEKEAKSSNPDLIFFSHVFFNSGWIVPGLAGLLKKLASLQALIVVDGYHALGAIDVDLSEIQERVFYLGGGYKYTQSGEGACFMHVPAGCQLRPKNTGWFADFAHLENHAAGKTQYATDANRFAGATFDPSGWYRFNAVMQWWKKDGITPKLIHGYVQSLQKRLLEGLPATGPVSKKSLLLNPTSESVGNFLSFVIPSEVGGPEKIHAALLSQKVTTDFRGSVLRIGFGLYQDEADVDQLIARIGRL